MQDHKIWLVEQEWLITKMKRELDAGVKRLKTYLRKNRYIIRLCEFIAVLVGVGAILIEFFVIQQIERDRYRTQTEIELNNSIGLLAVNKKKDIASPYIQNTVTLMNDGGYSMEGIALDGTKFYSVKLAEVPWKNVVFDDVYFDCIQSEEGDMRNDDRKTSLCNKLRSADFSSAILDDVEFRNADLSDADFRNAYFRESTIKDSWASGAEFMGAEFRGGGIILSNFSNAEFEKTKFHCPIDSRAQLLIDDCPELKKSDFSNSKMKGVRFEGAKITDVDFSGANTYLNETKFVCDGRNNDAICTELENVCLAGAKLDKAKFIGGDSITRVVLSNVILSGADLTRAEFKNVAISNVDFTGATNISKASFKNVSFEKVILDEFQMESFSKEFDKEILERLRKANNKDWKKEMKPDEIPCTPEWHEWLGGILPTQSLAFTDSEPSPDMP